MPATRNGQIFANNLKKSIVKYLRTDEDQTAMFEYPIKEKPSPNPKTKLKRGLLGSCYEAHEVPSL
jgi:hypothetical protein